MTLTVTYKKSALKSLRAIPQNTAEKLLEKINQYAAEPTAQYSWAKPLTGMTGIRIRQGDYRAVGEVINNEAVFHIYKIAHRKDVYR